LSNALIAFTRKGLDTVSIPIVHPLPRLTWLDRTRLSVQTHFSGSGQCQRHRSSILPRDGSRSDLPERPTHRRLGQVV
jgi:hypothetical protein